MSIETGEIVDGKYRVVREIGSGSMGAVFEGENTVIRRKVAIKVLHPGVADNESTVRRFEREAQAAGRIGSDHIVEVLDLGGLPDGSYYMVMEYLEGASMAERLHDQGRLKPREVVPIVQQILTGLEAAHEARIIHRDLKPDNIFLLDSKAGHSDFVKLLDFGVSKFNPLNTEEGMDLTKAGTVVGTPFYMSPEQAKGSKDIDARSDLYSVGIILYESITGQKPFHAGTFNELIFKIVLDTPPPPEEFVPDLDPAFSRIVRKAMARTPDDRFQSAAEMRDALSVWLHTGDDELAATHLMDPLPPPPAPGRDVGPPPRLAQGELGEGEGSTCIIEPDDDDGNATHVAPRPPPPPLVPRELAGRALSGRTTDRPFGRTDIPGVRSSAQRKVVAIVVGVAASALALGGIAAVAWTSAGAAASAEPAALSPSAAQSADEPADSELIPAQIDDPHGESESTADGDETGAESAASEEAVAGSDESEPPQPAAPAEHPAGAHGSSPPQTERSTASSTKQGEPPQSGGAAEAPPASPAGSGKSKGISGRSIATEL